MTAIIIKFPSAKSPAANPLPTPANRSPRELASSLARVDDFLQVIVRFMARLKAAAPEDSENLKAVEDLTLQLLMAAATALVVTVPGAAGAAREQN